MRVGVIGTGAIGSLHARNLAHRTPGTQVVAVMDIDQERVGDVAGECGGARAYTDASALIADADVEAVLIASPDDVLARLDTDPPAQRAPGRRTPDQNRESDGRRWEFRVIRLASRFLSIPRRRVGFWRRPVFLPLVYIRWQLLEKPWVVRLPVSTIKGWCWKDIVTEPHQADDGQKVGDVMTIDSLPNLAFSV